MNKINAVRKYKGVHLPYQVLGECGAKPKTCGQKELEISSMCWKYEEKSNRISESNGEIISKSSYKVWNRFITWLRCKKLKVIKIFKKNANGNGNVMR